MNTGPQWPLERTLVHDVEIHREQCFELRHCDVFMLRGRGSRKGKAGNPRQQKEMHGGGVLREGSVQREPQVHAPF